MNYQKSIIILTIPALFSCANQPTTNHVTNHTTAQHWLNYINSRRPHSDLYNPNSNIDINYIVPNFSYAGYHNSNQNLPHSYDNFKYFNVINFGAKPDDGISDRRAIIKTIKAMTKYRQTHPDQGLILYFPKGQFILTDNSDIRKMSLDTPRQRQQNQVIHIKNLSNFIIKGSGVGQTTLYLKHDLLPKQAKILHSTVSILTIGVSNKKYKSPVSSRITSNSVPYATKTITVAKNHRFKVGDDVIIKGLVNDPQRINEVIHPYKMEINHKNGKYKWSNLANGLIIAERKHIKQIKGNKITFNSPIITKIMNKYKLKLQKIQPNSEIGIENLTFKGNWHQKFRHHRSALDDGGYSMLALQRNTNSWLRNLEFIDCNRGISLYNNSNLSIDNIKFSGNPGHMSLSILYSNNVLVQNIYDQSKAWHAPGVGNVAIGNVFRNIYYDKNRFFNIHAMQPRNNLFENTHGGWVYGHWGGAPDKLPNHLWGLYFWNTENTGISMDNYQFMRAKHGQSRIIMPHVIGLYGQAINFGSQRAYSDYATGKGLANYQPQLPNKVQAFVESNGQMVQPQSLFMAQLEQRKNIGKKYK